MTLSDSVIVTSYKYLLFHLALSHNLLNPSSREFHFEVLGPLSNHTFLLLAMYFQLGIGLLTDKDVTLHKWSPCFS